jgi:uncharacterized protein involved in exopolysaccharide biosynthesis
VTSRLEIEGREKRDHGLSSRASGSAGSPGNLVTQATAMLWGHRRFIVASVALSTFAAVAISLIVKPSYESRVTLLPSGNNSNALASALGQLGQLGSLLGGRGDNGIGRLTPTIAQSEAVLRGVIYKKYQTNAFPDSVNLIQYWRIQEATPRRDYEVAELTLRGSLDVHSDPSTGIIEILMKAPEPKLAADMLRAHMESLDSFLRLRNRSAATNQREWVERRVEEVRHDLDRSEAQLQQFMAQNRVTAGSPVLEGQSQRLQREVTFNAGVYGELRRQLELAKVSEIQNAPVINVLDSAQVPQVRTYPRRTRTVMLTFAFSAFASVIAVFLWALYGGALRDTVRETVALIRAKRAVKAP